MSLHFEWTLSMRFRRDVPERFLDEVRTDFGVGPAPRTDSVGRDYLPGGRVARLELGDVPVSGSLWGLYVRASTTDDSMYEFVVLTALPKVAAWSATQGWVGFAREEMSLDPWLNFYVQNGHAYVAEPGGGPHPVVEGAPPFTLTQTLDAVEAL